MKSLGRGNIKLMGSDGLFDPQFSALGSITCTTRSSRSTRGTEVAAFKKVYHGTELFGAPSYVARRSSPARSTGRARTARPPARRFGRRSKKTKVGLKASLLGLPVAFDGNGNLKQHPFGIYQSKKGVFARVG